MFGLKIATLRVDFDLKTPKSLKLNQSWIHCISWRPEAPSITLPPRWNFSQSNAEGLLTGPSPNSLVLKTCGPQMLQVTQTCDPQKKRGSKAFLIELAFHRLDVSPPNLLTVCTPLPQNHTVATLTHHDNNRHLHCNVTPWPAAILEMIWGSAQHEDELFTERRTNAWIVCLMPYTLRNQNVCLQKIIKQ